MDKDKQYTLEEFLALVNGDFKAWAANRPRTLESWSFSLEEFCRGR